MSESSGYKHYVAGLVSGVSMVIVGHPFDTVKVNLQKHNTSANGFKYTNGLQCTTRILKTEGVRGLYRGATPSFVGMAFESCILFGIYSQTKQFLQRRDHNNHIDKPPEPHIIIPSAAFAGSIISFILCPSELIKCRMQIHSHRYTGPLNCAMETLKTEGVSGLFRGGVTTLLRECIGNAVFFSTYEYLRHSIHSQLKHRGFDHTNLMDVGVGIVSGGLSGIAFWSAVLPLDVAKTIIQTTMVENNKKVSTNPFEMLKLIYRRSGFIRGCYAGLGPTVSRAFPANAAAIVTFEGASKLLGIDHNHT